MITSHSPLQQHREADPAEGMGTKAQKVTKLLILGDASVGKTSIVMKFCDDTSIEGLKNLKPTIGIDFKVKTLTVDSHQVRLQIWDTAGTERFHSIAKGYYKGTEGVIIVFDLTDMSTFQHVDSWIKHIEEEAPILLLGNKKDLNDARAVRTQLAEAFAHNHSLLYWEVSAWTGQNIEEAFKEFARVLLSKKMADRSSCSSSSASISPPSVRNGDGAIVVAKSRSEEGTPHNASRCCK